MCRCWFCSLLGSWCELAGTKRRLQFVGWSRPSRMTGDWWIEGSLFYRRWPWPWPWFGGLVGGLSKPKRLRKWSWQSIHQKLALAMSTYSHPQIFGISFSIFLSLIGSAKAHDHHETPANPAGELDALILIHIGVQFLVWCIFFPIGLILGFVRLVDIILFVIYTISIISRLITTTSGHGYMYLFK